MSSMMILGFVIAFITFIILLLFGVMGWALWSFHSRLEDMATKLQQVVDKNPELSEKLALLESRYEPLVKRLKEGEEAIVENFATIEKRFAKIEHEIKESQRVGPKAQEALKTIARLEKVRAAQAESKP